jgi:hypothetical protein
VREWWPQLELKVVWMMSDLALLSELEPIAALFSAWGARENEPLAKFLGPCR